MRSVSYQYALNKITEKTCTCVGLGTSALLAYNLDTKVEGEGVSVCPGPNMAYYSKIMSLKNITDHIYGRDNMISRTDRPNMFINELNIYVDFLKNKFEEAVYGMDRLLSGRQYYFWKWVILLVANWIATEFNRIAKFEYPNLIL